MNIAPAIRARVAALFGRYVRRPWSIWALVGVFAACVVFRAAVLFQHPYPPSGDAAGDLYSAQVWLGHPLAGLAGYSPEPPLYFFAIVIPFTAAFPVFTGIKLLMAVVPALLVFPSYLLERKLGVGKGFSLLGAALVGSAASFSLMVSWNSGFNLFGIFFLLFLLAALVEYLRSPTSRGAIWVALAFAAVVATHPLTSLIAGGTLVVSLGVSLAPSTVPFRTRLGRAVKLVGACVLFALPFAPLYLPIFTSSANAGVASYGYTVASLYASALPLPWGFDAFTLNPILLVDLALTVLSLAALARGSRGPGFTVLGSLLLVSALLLVLDLANGVRFLYFLTIPYLVGIPFLLEDPGRLFARWPRAEPAAPDRGGSVRRARRARLAQAAYVTIGVAFLLANVAVSEDQFSVSVVYYGSSLNAQAVSVMDWARNSTPTDSTFYDTVGLQTWMWAYGHRMDYEPQNLAGLVNTQSYQSGLTADYIDLGTHSLANGYFAVGQSYPSPINAPTIYLTSPNGWELFLGSQSPQDFFSIDEGHGVERLGFAYTDVVSYTSNVTAGVASSTFELAWESNGENLTFQTALDGPSLSFHWTGAPWPILSASFQFGIPPSGAFFGYNAVPAASNASSLEDSFAFLGQTLLLSFGGGPTTQLGAPGGWTTLFLNSTSGGIALHAAGLSAQSPSNVVATNSAQLLQSLGVTYVVVNSNDDYGMFYRMAIHHMVPGFNSTVAFQAGPYKVYELCYAC